MKKNIIFLIIGIVLFIPMIIPAHAYTTLLSVDGDNFTLSGGASGGTGQWDYTETSSGAKVEVYARGGTWDSGWSEVDIYTTFSLGSSGTYDGRFYWKFTGSISNNCNTKVEFYYDLGHYHEEELAYTYTTGTFSSTPKNHVIPDVYFESGFTSISIRIRASASTCFWEDGAVDFFGSSTDQLFLDYFSLTY